TDAGSSPCGARLAGVERDPVRPDDVVQAAALVGEALQPVVDKDWSVRAGSLDWDVDTTVAHMAGAAAKYALCLSSTTTHFIALRLVRYPDASRHDLLHAVASTAL